MASNTRSKCRRAFRDLSEELSKIRDHIQSDAVMKFEERNALQKKALNMLGGSDGQDGP